MRAGRRLSLTAAIVLAGGVAFLSLGLAPEALWPRGAGFETTRAFFAAAFAPDLSMATLRAAAGAVATTILVAAASMTIALALGLGLGFFASSAVANPIVRVPVRVLIALMRSIHELMWAMLFLHAIGLGTIAAVVAIAIPYAGTLAKVFSEMIDEAPRDAAFAIEGAGAGSVRVFLFGLLPHAVPDLAAYAFYRFECALRSSAILGFFGVTTLGYYLGPAFDSSHYDATWTYLYALFLLVVVVDLWSGRLRRTVVA